MNKKLPQLNSTKRTLESLREAMQPLRSARFGGCAPLPNKIQYSVHSRSYGASTGELTFGGELQLDYVKAEIRYVKNDKMVFTVPLKGENQVSLADKVFDLFKEHKCDIEPDREKITETTTFDIDVQVAKNYAEAQHRISTALAKAQGHMNGYKTAVALWPHGFDLSFLWFKDGHDEMKDPHMNFGFSPGFGEDEPYLYFYAWPTPAEMLQKKLPEGGKWQSTWSAPGAVFGYSTLQKQANPEEYIEKLLLKFYHDMEPILVRASKEG